MPRPRKATKELFFDQFADFDLADQEIVLDFLLQLHRQAKRQASRYRLEITTTGSDHSQGSFLAPEQDPEAR